MKKMPDALRTVVLAGILIAIFAAYSVKLAQMQLINPENWTKDANPKNQRTAVVPAARGEILDRYGRPLSVNREGYNIVFDGAYLTRKAMNSTILTLSELLTESSEGWRDELPMTGTSPYAFLEKETAKVSALKRKLALNTYATAENCYDTMVKRYNLENFTKEKQRLLMGVRYTMDLEDFSVASRYIFAEDISVNTTLKVKENSQPLVGVDVDVVPIREYSAPDIAPHILGMVTPMPANYWNNNKASLLEKGYRISDSIGTSGMEQYAEDYLRGVNGKKLITQDASGKVTGVEVVQEPVAGNSLVLTIDRKLQKVAQDSLGNMIETMKRNNPADAANIAGNGAVVVMKVNTGEILAAATYPGYNLDTFYDDYETKILNNKGNPLTNRAFMGQYPIGSTFKPATALVGLQTGALKDGETIRCTGTYHISGMRFKCLASHGNVNIISALSKSCNTYFYETGRRVGIANLNLYTRLFGLGVKNGLELDESAGILAGPEYSASNKKVWNPGDTIQAAIGQSDNAITPLQLAVYTSTIANNGTRYRAHLTKEIKNYGLTETVKTVEPEVLNTTGIEKRHYDTVKQGMLSVTSQGTARGVFENYKLKVGGKTGTAINNTPYDHSVFIAFAPYENPEIAIGLVLENALKGSRSSEIAKDILDAYFFPEITEYTQQPTEQLLP